MTITLANLHTKTAQEVFDHVARHLLTQRERSESLEHCVYRAEHLKCAAGCLIADGEYRSSLEGRDWSELISEGGVPSAHRILIRKLQIIHDIEEPEFWKWELLDLAQFSGLSISVIDEF